MKPYLGGFSNDGQQVSLLECSRRPDYPFVCAMFRGELYLDWPSSS